eukprot:6594924-Prorocentrum_lima.AAC.1
MSRPPLARHSPRHQTQGRRDVESGRIESARSRSNSPTLRDVPDHPMGHGTSGAEMMPSTQGYEPNVPGLELVVSHRLTVLPQE